MPPKKGLATTKKVEKYVYLDADSEEVNPPSASAKEDESVQEYSSLKDKSTSAKQPDKESWSLADSDEENIDPANPRGIPKLSNSLQPRQEPESFHSNQLEQNNLVNSLFPPDEEESALPRLKLVGSDITAKPLSAAHRTRRPFDDLLRKPSPLHERNAQTEQQAASHARATKLSIRLERSDSGVLNYSHQPQLLSSDPPIYKPTTKMANMIPGGAFVPPNQQRNLRACMVCSIVRTYTQFMNGGCPNCEDILELTGNSENVNDCTSQVFEGLITVADTSKSWVARYQRLEGYVPGVYATQVEGILPEEIVSAIEAAGINYVPRDGSEDQMIPKD